MASSPEFARYVAEQMSEAGVVTYKKLFGEYGLYCDGKFFALICDDRFYLKMTDEARALAAHLGVQASAAPPYDGAKDALLVEDVDNREALCALARATCGALPEKKQRRKIARKQTP